MNTASVWESARLWLIFLICIPAFIKLDAGEIGTDTYATGFYSKRIEVSITWERQKLPHVAHKAWGGNNDIFYCVTIYRKPTLRQALLYLLPSTQNPMLLSPAHTFYIGLRTGHSSWPLELKQDSPAGQIYYRNLRGLSALSLFYRRPPPLPDNRLITRCVAAKTSLFRYNLIYGIYIQI